MLNILHSLRKKILRTAGDHGTSLIEVLASMVIVVLIVQLTYIIVFSTSQTARSGDVTAASYYAVTLIESVKAEGIDSGSHQFDEDNSFHGIKPPEGMEAEVTITPVEEESLLFFIEISVNWIESGQPRQLEMASIFRRDIQ